MSKDIALITGIVVLLLFSVSGVSSAPPPLITGLNNVAQFTFPNSVNEQVNGATTVISNCNINHLVIKKHEVNQLLIVRDSNVTFVEVTEHMHSGSEIHFENCTIGGVYFRNGIELRTKIINFTNNIFEAVQFGQYKTTGDDANNGAWGIIDLQCNFKSASSVSHTQLIIVGNYFHRPAVPPDGNYRGFVYPKASSWRNMVAIAAVGIAPDWSTLDVIRIDNNTFQFPQLDQLNTAGLSICGGGNSFSCRSGVVHIALPKARSLTLLSASNNFINVSTTDPVGGLSFLMVNELSTSTWVRDRGGLVVSMDNNTVISRLIMDKSRWRAEKEIDRRDRITGVGLTRVDGRDITLGFVDTISFSNNNVDIDYGTHYDLEPVINPFVDELLGVGFILFGSGAPPVAALRRIHMCNNVMRLVGPNTVEASGLRVEVLLHDFDEIRNDNNTLHGFCQNKIKAVYTQFVALRNGRIVSNSGNTLQVLPLRPADRGLFPWYCEATWFGIEGSVDRYQAVPALGFHNISKIELMNNDADIQTCKYVLAAMRCLAVASTDIGLIRIAHNHIVLNTTTPDLTGYEFGTSLYAIWVNLLPFGEITLVEVTDNYIFCSSVVSAPFSERYQHQIAPIFFMVDPGFGQNAFYGSCNTDYCQRNNVDVFRQPHERAEKVRSIVVARNIIVADGGTTANFRSGVTCIGLQTAVHAVAFGSIAFHDNDCVVSNIPQCPPAMGCAFSTFNYANKTLDFAQILLENNRFEVRTGMSAETDLGSVLPLSLMRITGTVYDVGVARISDNYFLNGKPAVNVEIVERSVFDVNTILVRGNTVLTAGPSPRGINLVNVVLCGLLRSQSVIIAHNRIVGPLAASDSGVAARDGLFFRLQTQLGESETLLTEEQKKQMPSGLNFDTVVTRLYCRYGYTSIEKSVRFINNSVVATANSKNFVPLTSFSDSRVRLMPLDVPAFPLIISIGKEVEIVKAGSATAATEKISQSSQFMTLNYFAPTLAAVRALRPPWLVAMLESLDSAAWDELDFAGMPESLIGTGTVWRANHSSSSSANKRNGRYNNTLTARLFSEQHVGGWYSIGHSLNFADTATTSASSQSVFSFSGPDLMSLNGGFFSLQDSFQLSSATASTFFCVVPTAAAPDNRQRMTQLPQHIVLESTTLEMRCLSSSGSSPCAQFSETTITSNHVIAAPIASNQVSVIKSHLRYIRNSAGSRSIAALSLPWLQNAIKSKSPPSLRLENSSITIEFATSSGVQPLHENDIVILVPTTASVNSSNFELFFIDASAPATSPQRIVTLVDPVLPQVAASTAITTSSTSAPATTAAQSEQQQKTAITDLIKSLNRRTFNWESTNLHAPLILSRDLRLTDGSKIASTNMIHSEVHCFALNGFQQRKNSPLFSGMAGLARPDGANFFSGCPHSATVSQTASISPVPFCAPFTFEYNGPRINIVEAKKAGRVTATFSVVPNRFADTPAPVGNGRIIPQNMNPVAGSAQSEAFTVFRAGLANLTGDYMEQQQLLQGITSAPPVSTLVAGRIQQQQQQTSNTNDKTSFSAAPQLRSGDLAKGTVLYGSSGSPLMLSVTVQLDSRISDQISQTIPILVDPALFACETPSRASSSSSSTTAGWFEAQLPLTIPTSGVSDTVKSATSTMSNVAVFITAPLSGPLVGGALARAGAVIQFAECSFSMSKGSELPFIESPFGFGFGADHGYWRRGALVGNVLVAFIIFLLLALIAAVRVNASRRRHAQWMKKHQAEVEAQKDVLRAASIRKPKNGTEQPPVEAASQRRLEQVREASLRKLKDLKKQRVHNEPKVLSVIDALYLAKLPATFCIPFQVLCQGTVSSAVSLMLGGVNIADRLFGAFFTLLFFCWLLWMLRVVFIQLPAHHLRFVPRARDARRFWGQPDPNLGADDAERQTRIMFQSCDQCRPALKALKQQNEAAAFLKQRKRQQQQRNSAFDDAEFGEVVQPRREFLMRRPVSYKFKWLFWQIIGSYGDWQFIRPSKHELKKKFGSLKNLTSFANRSNNSGGGGGGDTNENNNNRKSFDNNNASFLSTGAASGAVGSSSSLRSSPSKLQKEGERELERLRKEAENANKLDPTFVPRTGDVYVQVSSNCVWYICFDFGVAYVIAFLSGVQTILPNCEVSEIIVAIINALPFAVVVAFWPMAERINNIFALCAAALIMTMSLTLALTSIMQVPAISLILANLQLALSVFGMFKSFFDIALLAATFEGWIMLPMFFLIHVLFHTDGPLAFIKNKIANFRQSRADKKDEKARKQRSRQLAYLLGGGNDDDDSDGHGFGGEEPLLMDEMLNKQQPLGAASRRNPNTSCWTVDQITEGLAPRGMKQDPSPFATSTAVTPATPATPYQPQQNLLFPLKQQQQHQQSQKANAFLTTPHTPRQQQQHKASSAAAVSGCSTPATQPFLQIVAPSKPGGAVNLKDLLGKTNRGS